MNTKIKGNIEKGVYAHNQVEGYISVREFIILEQEGKRCLLVRYANNSELEVNRFDLVLTQMDVNGNEIKRDKFRYNDLALASGELYSPEMGIVIEDNCADFTIKILSFVSGQYTYAYRRGQITAHYDIKELAGSPADDSPYVGVNIQQRNFSGRKFYKFIAVASLALAFLSLVYVAFCSAT